jgi:hypothetical protein
LSQINFRDASDVAAARGDGGHVLIRPFVNGAAAPGWFAIDTSSCGHAIDPEYADALGAPAFGRLAVVGAAAASLAGAFRRGDEVAVGAARVPSPLFMEQALAGAMRCPALPGDGRRRGVRLRRGRRRPAAGHARHGLPSALRAGDPRAQARSGVAPAGGV